ncbi:amino acid ABC transporter substrate-binding protein [Thalassotalea sp. M1531]|uniref:Amino acid ABC transporter substrate-binding protein n=1 Tax=Thalassotalea algicola TaxID=2716224 RepID=A0A7Y0Q867_9GAMM|nr:transporter substrate-binding domain-containing protein [Thalassotalea algicola]NMP31805.1 amino acid ABC transporter substrate-binding protein [Thalassotalea algicola]
MTKIFGIIVLLLASSVFAEDKPVISVYSYHLKPPLIVNSAINSGLYFDFVDYLNRHSNQYQFQLIHVPRKRLERMLEENILDGILLGVNPVWFKDKKETKYYWTSRVFTDRDEVISLNTKPLEYNDSQSLTNKVFGGVRGFYYFGINELIQEKKALRVDTVNEVDLFSMLLAERIDAAVVSRSTIDYMIKVNHWQGKFHLSRKPHDIYDRRILIPKSQRTIYQYLTPIIDQLQFDPDWQATLEQYR